MNPRQTGALEPKLTGLDQRIVGQLPARRSFWANLPAPYGAPRQPALTAWEIAERLRVYDVGLVERALRGLEHLGYASSIGWHGTKKRQRYYQGHRLEEC